MATKVAGKEKSINTESNKNCISIYSKLESGNLTAQLKIVINRYLININ